MSFLRDAVVAKIAELGEESAAEFFQVAVPRIKQWRAGSKPITLAAAEKVVTQDSFNPAAPVEAGWGGRDVCLCLPFYKTVHPMTCFSLLGILDRTKMRVMMLCGDAFIAHTRNAIAKQFLDTECAWSFWVDDDILFPTGDAGWFKRASGFTTMPDKFAGVHILNRLLSHNKSCISGVYFSRVPNGKPLYAEGLHDKAEEAWACRGPYEIVKPTRWFGFGCALVHRDVFNAISAKYPPLAGEWFSMSEHDLVLKSKEALQILNDVSATPDARVQKVQEILGKALAASAHNAKLGTGEDIIFLHRAAQAGHQPFVDFSVYCAHLGGKAYGPKRE